jgi:hypothetical protein
MTLSQREREGPTLAWEGEGYSVSGQDGAARRLAA